MKLKDLKLNQEFKDDELEDANFKLSFDERKYYIWNDDKDIVVVAYDIGNGYGVVNHIINGETACLFINACLDSSNNFEYIKNKIETLVHKRFKDKESLEKHISELINYPIQLNESDPSGLVADYAFIGDINGESFIEVYYLISPYGEEKIYVTEVNFEDY